MAPSRDAHRMHQLEALFFSARSSERVKCSESEKVDRPATYDRGHEPSISLDFLPTRIADHWDYRVNHGIAQPSSPIGQSSSSKNTDDLLNGCFAQRASH